MDMGVWPCQGQAGTVWQDHPLHPWPSSHHLGVGHDARGEGEPRSGVEASLIRSWDSKGPLPNEHKQLIFSSQEENFLIRKEGKITGTDCVYLHFISFTMSPMTMFLRHNYHSLKSTLILIWTIHSSLLGGIPAPAPQTVLVSGKGQQRERRLGPSLP